MGEGLKPVKEKRTEATMTPAPAIRDTGKKDRKREDAKVQKLEGADSYKKEDRKLETVVKGGESQTEADKTSTERPVEKPTRIEHTKKGAVYHYKPIYVGDKFATRGLNDKKTAEAAKRARRGQLKIAREKVIRITVGGFAPKPVTSSKAPSPAKVAGSLGGVTGGISQPRMMSFAGARRTPFKGALRFGNSWSGYSAGTAGIEDSSDFATFDDAPVTGYSTPVPAERSPAATLVFDVSGVNRGGTIMIVDRRTGEVVKVIHLKPGQKIQKHTVPVPKGDYDVKIRAAKTRSASKGKAPDPKKDDLDNITVRVSKIEGGGAEAPKETAAKK